MSKKVNDMSNDEINNVVNDLFDGIDQDAVDMLDRYKSGDKVKDICNDYEISTETFYKMIKPLQDREAGIEPASKPEPKKSATKKSATKKTATKKTIKLYADEGHSSEPTVTISKPEPKSEPKPEVKPADPKPKRGPGPVTGSGVVVYRNSEVDGIVYIKDFKKTKGGKSENSSIKFTTKREEAKVWRTLYAAVDFLCKREPDTMGWTLAHEE